MKTDFDAIVLGLGGLGSAAAYWLSKRLGGGVLGLEQFELGHERGSSQDHSRIIRYSYHAPEYVELAKKAYDAWSVVEAESARQLVVKTGGLDLFPPGCANDIADYRGSLEAGEIAYELLEADEVRARWPQFHIDDATRALFQADGGLVRAATANETHRRLAIEHGAILRNGTPVSSLHATPGEVTVATAAATYRCRHLVITAGAWTRQVVQQLNLELPLTVTREQVVYFEPTGRAEHSPERLPIWIWMEEPSF
jgi:sarcosine oxidase